MALRFRRSVKIAPGLRLNVGKRGVSVSAGVRGARLTVGSSGVYGSAGIPGSGLSMRGKLSGRGQPTRAQSSTAESLQVTLSLRQDGKVEILGPDGNPLPRRLVGVLREQQGEFIQQWLEERCREVDGGIESLLSIHLRTPAPGEERKFRREPFELAGPERPKARPPGLLGQIFASRRQRIERENAEAQSAWREALSAWEGPKTQHQRRQDERARRFEAARTGRDAEAMHDHLEEVLATIQWPRETLISYQVDESRTPVFLDVDLPEIEDMPDKQARVAARGLRINIRDRSETQRRKDYMRHIHAVGFRLMGEVLAALPTVQEVVLSGFSQWPDRATGRIEDQYLLSVRAARSQWERIDFHNLQAVDVVEAIGSFDLRRRMTKTGIFKPIEPFVAGREMEPRDD